MGAQGKRHTVWMPSLDACTASTAHTLTLCALRAPSVPHTFHFCFELCRAREVNAQTPNKRNGDKPSVLTKLTTRKQCMRVT